MPADFVVDASLLGAAFFREGATPVARRFLETGPSLVAPELLWTEIANLAARKISRGEATLEVGKRAIEAISQFVGTAEPLRPLAQRAFVLAATHRFSADDGAYLALAEARGIPIATMDRKFALRAADAGLDRLVFVPS